jgi:hypothetical protein
VPAARLRAVEASAAAGADVAGGAAAAAAAVLDNAPPPRIALWFALAQTARGLDEYAHMPPTIMSAR